MLSRFCSARLCLVTALCLATSAGGLPGQRSLGFGAGRISVRQYNQLASPLNYDGGGTALTVGYYAERLRSAWAVQVDAQFGELKPADTDALGSRASTVHLKLSVPVMRQVAGTAGGRNLRVGVALAGDLLFRDHSYGGQRGSESYADAFAGFDGVLRASSGLRRATRVSVEVAAPLLRVAWRTPYAGLKYAPPAQLALPDRYRALDLEVLLQRTFSRHWSWTAGLHLWAFSDRSDWTLQQGTRMLTLGLRRQIGGGR